ncbi:reverse transcriptase domain-containing protein [Tanacetum coccineum]
MATMAENVIGAEKLRYDSDIKAVNIHLLGFSADIYTLINHYHAAKEIWDRVKELMEGTYMTKQERESMLYDEFDKFTSKHGELIHSYYLRYAKLINNMKMIPMSMSNMRINTKFVNRLQPEWSRFFKAAKQARDLHSVNFDQLYDFLKHNERDAKEVREMRQQFLDPLALPANTYNPPPLYSSQHIHYAPTVVHQPSTLQPDTEFVVPTFLPTNDPIASLNKAMIFLSFAYSSRYPPINNQLRTSSDPRTHATIQNGQVMVQNVQGRPSQGYTGSAGKNQALGARVFNTFVNARANQTIVIRCYNCTGEGHIAKHCTAKKRVKDSEWFKDKMLLAQAQEAGVLQATANFKANHVDAYDSDCNDKAIANAIFIKNLSPIGSINGDTVEPCYDSDILSEVPHYDIYHNTDVLNSNVQEMGYIENIVSNNESFNELTSNSNVISYADYLVTIGNDVDNYVPPPIQNNNMTVSVIKQMKSQVGKNNTVAQETQSVNESLTSELERYKERIKTLENESKNSASNRETFLDRELRTAIWDRN